MEKSISSPNDSDPCVKQIISDVSEKGKKKWASQPVLIRDLLLPIQAMNESPDRNELLAKYFQ